MNRMVTGFIFLRGIKMGLFSNNKKSCPVCGEPTPRLLPTKLDNIPICKVCASKIELPEGMVNQMSIEAFTEYIAFYDNNQPLRDVFQETFTYSQGFLKADIAVDMANRLFRLRNAKDALVFEAANLKSFRILEDSKVLYESRGNTLICNESDVPEKINGMHTVVEQFRARRQQYEFMERMQRREEAAARQRGEDYNGRYISCPFFEGNEPFNNFYIELDFEHPYWENFHGEVKGTKFSSTNPEISTYLCEYQNAVEKLHELAMNLMQIISPGATEVFGGDKAVSAPTQATMVSTESNAIEEIKKYKELLDAGILTEEEFAAKKRQLLGL